MENYTNSHQLVESGTELFLSQIEKGCLNLSQYIAHIDGQENYPFHKLRMSRIMVQRTVELVLHRNDIY